MLIGHTVHALVLFGMVMTSLRGLWILLRDRHRRRRAAMYARFDGVAPPPAIVRGGGTGVRGVVARCAPPAMLLVGAAGALELHLDTTDVWVVTDAARGVSVAHDDYLGDARAAYAPRAGTAPIDDEAWIDNQSSRVVRVEYTAYGVQPLPARYADATTIAPHATASVGYIDDIGPDQPPPGQIDARAPALRGWLTW